MLNALELFEKRLPDKCRSANIFAIDNRIRRKEKSLKKHYIQPNSGTHLYYLVLDIDQDMGALQWEFKNAPAPNFVAINRENAHCHYFYSLETSVCTSDLGSLKAIRYASDIEAALCYQLGADTAYNGVLAKNPLHDHWIVHQQKSRCYTLDELADSLDLKAPKKAPKTMSGIGRNVETFDRLRKWAYKSYRQGYPSFERFLEACLVKTRSINMEFTKPLSSGEQRDISKSVAKYVASKFSQKGFNEWATKRGRIGGKNNSSENQSIKGKKSKRGASMDSEATLKPWVELGISRRTYYNRKKLEKDSVKQVILD